MLRRSFAALPALLLACAGHAPRARRGWAARHAAHVTQLRERGPAPAKWQPQPVPDGVRELRYRSAGRELLAWYAAPPGATGCPGLVYFHGEFSFAAWDFAQVRPFLAAGYAVLTPSLRGENGNPGDFELLHGEVDDAIAAVRTLAGMPEVDARKLYSLGHSVGGGLSALLALVPELPLVATASVGGIYSTRTFLNWSRFADTRPLVRFDPSRRDEVELRVLGPNLADMCRPHRAYVGREDAGILANARALAAAAGDAPFSLREIAGDHAASLQPGVRAYLDDLSRGTVTG